jgi:hypothetical protein
LETSIPIPTISVKVAARCRNRYTGLVILRYAT